MKKKLFVIGLVVLAFGAGYLSYFLIQKQISPQIINVYGINELVNSKLTQYFNILFSGEVTNLSDTTLTIGRGDSILDFDISKNAVFYRKSKEELAPAEQIKREDIKIGDSVNVWASFERNGSIASLNVMVSRGASEH